MRFMQVKRIIPCLDVHDGKVVKGVKFLNLRDAGDPVELAAHYNQQGADELVFLDINASSQGRKTIIDIVQRTAKEVSIPFTVGGGIGSLGDIEDIFRAGANKVSINSAAIREPAIITEGSLKYGSKSIVIAIDAKKKNGDSWEVYVSGGKVATGLDVLDWAKKVERLGAGEILLTSMDRDGTRNGYDLELTAAVSELVDIPVIASGGVGNLEHLYKGIVEGKADAVLCASIFHYGEYTVKQAKEYLIEKGVPVKL